MFSAADDQWMSEALALAAKGLYTTAPNPRVGCLIVQSGRVVGRGWHERAGEAHAEARALAEAGSRAKGATAYVTLEPCAHIGRTGPCTQALLKSGISTVVASVEDPNPAVAGKGFEQLRASGIAVRVGLLAQEAEEINRGFFMRMREGRSWMRLKSAASLDGRTALPNGSSQWITDAVCRADGHHWRAQSCAVLTGMGTFERDQPLLTVREVETSRPPWRILLCPRLDCDPDAPFFRHERAMVFCLDAARSANIGGVLERLEGRGVSVESLPPATGVSAGSRRIDLQALAQRLAALGMNEVQLEIGSRLAGGFLRDGLIDEWLLYQAPVVLGNGMGLFDDLPSLEGPNQAPRWRLIDQRRLGDGFVSMLRPQLDSTPRSDRG